MTEPLRVAVPPLGPVRLTECVHVPPEQLVLPLREAVPPLGPAKLRLELHEPLAHEPEPEECQLRPLGPVPLLERDQPASAIEAPATIRATAR